MIDMHALLISENNELKATIAANDALFAQGSEAMFNAVSRILELEKQNLQLQATLAQAVELLGEGAVHVITLLREIGDLKAARGPTDSDYGPTY